MVPPEVIKKLAAAAAESATLCDHAEHLEAAEHGALIHVANALCESAYSICAMGGWDPVGLYARRLDEIEGRSPLRGPSGREGALAATCWRDLQLVQVDHDRAYHPDVFGMSRLDQLRHYAFHLAKFPDAVLRGDDEELRSRRVPDMLLFAIKLWTLGAVRLPDATISAKALSLPEPS